MNVKVVGVYVLGLALCVDAHAGLQNVTIDGEIKIRARYRDQFEDGPGTRLEMPAFQVPGRPIGTGGAGITSRFDFSHVRPQKYVEQKTLLGVNADFTNHVRAYVQLEQYNVWGRDFRSNYITGADFPRARTRDVQVQQSYIEANNFFAEGLRMRIGRQEMRLGKGFLISEKQSSQRNTSWDGVRFTYERDRLTLDTWYAILAENSAIEQDEDVIFTGVYGSYDFSDWVSASAYYLLIRDGRSLNDTNFIAPVEWLEDAFGIDDYDPTYLQTVGVRVWGQSGMLDYDLDLAYQFGNADAVGVLFKPFGVYGDDDAEFDNFGGDIELGYTFDWGDVDPRVYVGAAYYEGEDNRDLNFLEWLSPFDTPEASVSFNRHWSGIKYSNFFDNNMNMSNVIILRGGVEFTISDAVDGFVELVHYQADEPFDLPRHFNLGSYFIPIAPSLSFWTEEGDDDIGLVAKVGASYDYSEDLSMKLQYEHLFTGDALEDGVFTDRMGIFSASAGGRKEDKHYLEGVVSIKF